MTAKAAWPDTPHSAALRGAFGSRLLGLDESIQTRLVDAAPAS